ncbi:MAG: ATP-binding protein, partial [Gemmatimonadaceae bacterium]|nr:ATP-binding protein [Gemmatimonadaceae bacterium]
VLMGRSYPRRFLRLWAVAWLGEAMYAVSSTLALLLRTRENGLPLSLLLTLLGQWGGYLSVTLIPLGAWAIRSGPGDMRPIVRRAIIAAFIAAALATFAVPWSDPSASALRFDPSASALRFAVRVALERFMSASSLVLAAWFMWQVARRTPRQGYRWLAAVLVAIGLFRLQYVFVGLAGIREVTMGSASVYFALLPLFETLLLAAFGVSTAIAVVEDEGLQAREAVERQLEAERIANTSVASLASALSAIPDQVVVLDVHGAVQAWNTAYEDGAARLGLGPPVVGQRFEDQLPPGAREEWAPRLAELLAGMPLAFESDHGTAGRETPRSFDISARPILDGDVVSGAVIVCRDVTARRALEARLQQTQRLDTVGRLAGGIAHDFNNLLTAILGSVSMARETLPVTHEAQSDLGDVQLAAERAAQLTRQLLAFARRHPVQQESIDVGERVAVMERMLMRLVGPNVQLRMQLAESLWPVRADATQLEQVVVNLVVNARDAMPNGGTLMLRTANRVVDARESASLFPRPLAAGDYVEIIVRDTGTGMDAETLTHAFEPFFTTKPVGQGTGLGLAMCYGIIRQQNGVIWLESEPGRGTTVHILFPRWHGEVAARPEVAAPAPAPQRAGTETVLLVEDEPQVRAVTARTLRGAGYRVLEATNGRDGLQVARRERGAIDIVLTDIVMPEMGGREMVELLRQFVPRVAVLYMSGFTAGALPIPTDDREARQFLQKPFTPVALLERIRVLLDDRDAGEPVPTLPVSA